MRCMADLYTVQSAQNKSGQEYANYDFITPFDLYAHGNSEFYVSSILRAISLLEIIGTTIFITLDNAAPNKNMSFFGGIAFILENVPKLKEVYLLFPSVGHTHNSVDSHFGNLEAVLKSRDMFTPQGQYLFPS